MGTDRGSSARAAGRTSSPAPAKQESLPGSGSDACRGDESCQEASTAPKSNEDSGLLRKRHSAAHLGGAPSEDTSSAVGANAESAADDDGGSSSAMPDFSMFPEYLRIGPWHLNAKLYLLAVAVAIAWYAPRAVESLRTEVQIPHTSAGVAEKLDLLGGQLRAAQAALCLYCVLVHGMAVKTMGWWPYVSYTMVAYFLLTLRLAALALGFVAFADAIRFPVLVMACITTTVWWLILVPLMCLFMPGGNKARRRFMKFNFSPFLFNVHLLNLPIAVLDHYLSWRPLVAWDLWFAIMLAFAYALWYLFALDANGMHFYIILSPRPWWCVFCYSMVFAIYIGVFAQLS
eukprot:TRINITY_DN56382_c0_g1_i1.p1 TRINITY_DN56382_c0_g1~~TRINITY_DN56382_c0_g1_i1.p1  ORF type:complete len:345 (-),score=67.50 TRINITY_DN56382_c0_g1_i1:70-1104(-)